MHGFNIKGFQLTNRGTLRHGTGGVNDVSNVMVVVIISVVINQWYMWVLV